VFAGQAAAGPKTIMQTEIIRLRRELIEGRAGLFPPAVRTEPPGELLSRHVRLIDGLIDQMYRASCEFADRQSTRTRHSSLAIAATGGYGRKELNPFSDIDIAFIPGEEEDPWVEAAVHMAFKLVMDVFLHSREIHVGYSFRPISEASTWDLAVKTSLLDARHLCGDRTLTDSLKVEVRRALTPLDLVLEEQLPARVKALEPALYSVEPNLKHGPGSLRDLHRARWIFKLLLSLEDDGELLPALAARGFLSDDAAAEIGAAAEWFWRARNWMHLYAGRRSDVLIVDYQDRIADELGGCSASDWLTRHIGHAEVLAMFKEAAVRSVLSGPVSIGAVRLENGDLHADCDPRKAVSLLHVSQRYGIPVSLRDAAFLTEERRRAVAVTEPLAEEVGEFLGILSEDRGISATLRSMARHGLLDRFLPGYSALMRLVPPDPSHTYTVGSHSLRIVECLEQLRSAQDPTGRYFGEILAQCTHFDMLCLAALLHDAGKAFQTSDHSESAMPLVAAVCERLNLSGEKRDLLEVLVRYHLLLVRTARLQDLKSSGIIQGVAEKCRNAEILRHLYVFTYADTRAVAEKSWTSLDFRDLQELYNKTQDVLTGKSQETEPSEAVQDRIGQIRRKLAGPNGPHGEDEVLRHCEVMPSSYVLNTRLDEIALHIQLLDQLERDPVVLDFYNRPGEDFTELTICAYDDPQPGMLAKITGVLFGCNADIQKAQVFTTAGAKPAVLDRLMIRSMGMQVTDNRAARIRTALRQVLTGAQSVDQFLDSKGKRLPARVPLEGVDVRNDLSEEHTVVHLIARDAHGLLYAMTRALSHNSLHIHTAKVATFGTRAENNFYVTSRRGGQIPDSELLALKDQLMGDLAGVSSR
jgi:[protein-PII] uridylyltransferase